MGKLSSFVRRHAKVNPPLTTDVVAYMLPGFAAFAAARMATRMATVQIVKRYPKAGRHAGAVAALGTFAAAWLGAHRVKSLEKYHHPIVIGTGLAALQSLVQIYMPQFAPYLGSPMPAALPSGAVGVPTLRQLPMPTATAAASAPAPIPAGFAPTTAASWSAYNDAYSSGAYQGRVEVPEAQTSDAPMTDSQEESISELLDNRDLVDNSDLDLDNSDMELFS